MAKKRRRGIYEIIIKPCLDVLLALLALALLWPLIVILAVIVRIRLGAPVIFKQERAGKNGKPFYLYKLRTMSDERDESGELLPDAQRLSGFGKMLRSTSLDELPSLWNVVCLKLSLVGPRPLYLKYVSRYSPEQARRLEVRPGVTGLAQVNGRNAISWEKRFEYDLQYVDNVSFLTDLKVILLTFVKVIRREGISSQTSVTMEEFMGSEEEPKNE